MGNPGKRKKNRREPKPKPLADLTPPEYLDPTAKAEWNRLAPQLKALDLLTEADCSLFASYCSAVSDFARCSKALRKYGLTSAGKLRPEFYAKRAAFLVIIRCCAEFGLSPSARARMSIEIKPATPKHQLMKALDGDDANLTVH